MIAKTTEFALLNFYLKRVAIGIREIRYNSDLNLLMCKNEIRNILKKRVDPTDEFPDKFLTRMFIIIFHDLLRLMSLYITDTKKEKYLCIKILPVTEQI